MERIRITVYNGAGLFTRITTMMFKYDLQDHRRQNEPKKLTDTGRI